MCLNFLSLCSFPFFVLNAYLQKFCQCLAVLKKMFAKSGKYTIFFCFCLTDLDSSLIQKCQVLRQIGIIVSFLRVNCIAQSELDHSWCHLENAHVCVSFQWFIWTVFGIEANRFVRVFSFQRQCSCCYLMKDTRSFYYFALPLK